MEICAIRSLVDCPDTIRAMLESKRARLEKVIAYCKEKKYEHCVAYLENARADMLHGFRESLGRKDDKPGRKAVQDCEHEGQRQQVEYGRGAECHQSQTRILLQRVRRLTVTK